MTAPLASRLGDQDTVAVARALIGARLVRGSGPTARVGRIVEVEAYVGEEDLACHARFGRTRRNEIMYGPPGRAYVYFVYGMYHCLNVVTELDGTPAAVLIRAVEPVLGASLMRRARMDHPRGGSRGRLDCLPDRSLAAGPGLVCAAFSISRAENGIDLCDPASDLRLEDAPASEVRAAISAGPRVGIGYAPEPWRSKPWRFFEPLSRSLSRGHLSGGNRR